MDLISRVTTINIREFLKIMRIAHWSKNSLIFLGFFIALIMNRLFFSVSDIVNVFLLFMSFSLISSGNYILNDYVDKEFDRYHKIKKNRIISLGKVSNINVFFLFFSFWILGLFLNILIENIVIFLSGCLFILFAILYNVPPLRMKNIPIFDVLLESTNSPLRFISGFLLLTPIIPSILMVFFLYFYTAVLMNSKRLAEYVVLGKKKAIKYRKVFKFYNTKRLIFLFVIYFLFTFLSLIVLISQYGFYIFFIPLILFAVQLLWYLKLSLKGDSSVQKPVYIYKNLSFFVYSLFTVGISVLLLLLRVIH